MAKSSLNAEMTTFDPKMGLNQDARHHAAKALGHVLADSYQLYIKTQGVHWNLAGPSFYSLHKLTEAQYRDLADAIDAVAERIRALGEHAPASYTTYGELAQIRDEDRPQSTAAMVDMLVRDNRTMAATLREAIHVADAADDIVTVDMLTARLKHHEENAWMLGMHTAE